MEMTNVSPSGHYRPSSTGSTNSNSYSSNNNILLQVTPVKKSTTSITNPGPLEASTFSFPRRPRSGKRVPTTWNKKNYIFGGEGEDGSSSETMMVKHEENRKMKEVKIKYKLNDENKRELEGLSVIHVKGEEVDLNFLARVADGAYGAELASMTECMSRGQLIGFMESLEGEWSGRSERRRVVDADEIVKALPIDWKIELSLRQRAGLPSIYCRSYVSPSGEHFKSCKDAAIYLKNKSLTDVGGPFEEEGQMGQINNGSHKLQKSADVNLLSSGELYDVKISTLIECSPCGIVFQDMRGLEKHLATFHKETTRRFDLPTRSCVLQKHADMDIDDEQEVQQTGQGSSTLQKPTKPTPVINKKFKTNCTWCNKEFLCEPVDTETMEDASGFMCPKCKDKLCGAFERSLLNSYQP